MTVTESFEQNQNFSNNFTKIDILQKLCLKSRFFEIEIFDNLIKIDICKNYD